MTNSKISPIELSSEEQALLDQISFIDLNHQVLRRSCQAAGKLMEMLLDRHAIPKIRIEYFNDPKYNIGKNRSRKKVFEDNGTKGLAIFYHGNFLKYLRYFIWGPNLPNTLIEDFCKEIDEEDLPAVARSLIRKHDLNSRDASEEFYKLCLECNLPEWKSRLVRDSVKSVR